MTPHTLANCLTAGAGALILAAVGVLLRRKGHPQGWAAIVAAFGAAGLGASLGWVACLALCEFVSVISGSGGGYVSFAFFWQNEFHPYLSFADDREVTSAAAGLNFRLGLGGAAVGAALALVAGWLVWEGAWATERGRARERGGVVGVHHEWLDGERRDRRLTSTE
jgi:hypothetical protein